MIMHKHGKVMFIQILRVYLEIAGSSASGLLKTLRDQRIAPALRLMHSDPGHSWHLEDLAKATAMSRTTSHQEMSKPHARQKQVDLLFESRPVIGD
jgi:hypothetical protein